MMACCSSSDDNGEQAEGMNLRIGSVTRTGDEELAPNPLPWGEFKLFMIPVESGESQSGTITYNGLDDGGDIIWNTSRLVVKPGRNYSMNFHDLPTVTDQDFCIVVGVKEGIIPLVESDQGSFVYHAPENTSDGYFVSLLADHLYASVEFRVTIANDYNVLRKVMLKKMVLKCQSSDKTLLDAVVTLSMNDQGTHPLVTDPVSTPKTGGAVEHVLYNNAEGVELSPTVFQSFSGCFAEGLGDGLSVECEYDIYDRVSGENNKIETRTVVNGLKSLLQNMKRGRKKVINLLVDPTYLYQLSDGDVDK